MNLRKAKDDPGWEPDFPEGISYGLLADLTKIGWGIYEYTLDDANENWKPAKPVSEELEALIDSGRRYPPALAIARDQMNHLFHGQRPSQDEFAEAYAKEIQSRLANQHKAPYLLAQVTRTELGYLYSPEWYWALRIKGDPPMVYWVSDDYFVYRNPLSDFDLTDEQIERLQY